MTLMEILHDKIGWYAISLIKFVKSFTFFKIKFVKSHVITSVMFYNINKGIEPLVFIRCCTNNLDILHPHMLMYTSHFKLPNP